MQASDINCLSLNVTVDGGTNTSLDGVRTSSSLDGASTSTNCGICNDIVGQDSIQVVIYDQNGFIQQLNLQVYNLVISYGKQ